MVWADLQTTATNIVTQLQPQHSTTHAGHHHQEPTAALTMTSNSSTPARNEFFQQVLPLVTLALASPD
jgi:hypothetical protein